MADNANAVEIDPRIELEFMKLQAQCWRMQQQVNAVVAENMRLRAEIDALTAKTPEEPQKLDS